MKMTKYMNNSGTGLNSDTLGALERIARESSYSLELRGGIDVRSNDTEDFPRISVRSLQEMLEQAYRLGRADGERSVNGPESFLREDAEIFEGLDPIDPNDPKAAKTAIEFSVPEKFSWKAKAVMEYLDDTGFIFAYKGKLVLTDESLYLSESTTQPYGGPRMVCGSWDELEHRLEEDYDGMKAEGLI